MTTAKQILDAIDQSEQRDSVVTVEINGDSGDALVAVDAATDADVVEINYVMCDREGVDTLDIWGTDVATGRQIWRLNVRFGGEQ